MSGICTLASHCSCRSISIPHCWRRPRNPMKISASSTGYTFRPAGFIPFPISTFTDSDWPRGILKPCFCTAFLCECHCIEKIISFDFRDGCTTAEFGSRAYAATPGNAHQFCPLSTGTRKPKKPLVKKSAPAPKFTFVTLERITVKGAKI